ncbi:non-specific lipid-transfer protein, partial [Escherichia coli]
IESPSFYCGAQMAAIVLLLVILIANTARPASAAVTCGQVAVAIAPCIIYARNGGTVPLGCCNGVRSLNSATKTTPDRQQACICLKKLVQSIAGIKMPIVSGIPAKCHVNIGYPISLSTDCSKVN